MFSSIEIHSKVSKIRTSYTITYHRSGYLLPPHLWAFFFNLLSMICCSNLTNLEWLDLSFNKLSEEIPSQLVDLTSLEVLKLSHNQLTGPIHSGNQFNTFNNDSYTKNLGLCGFPLSKTYDNHKAKRQPQGKATTSTYLATR